MRLPHLSDQQAEIVRRRAKPSGTPPDKCPTCDSTPDEYGERENGKYKLFGQVYDCDCATQIMLRKHYLLANIPDKYHPLDWKRDFKGDPAAVEPVEMYLDKWPSFKAHGMGVEFAGSGLGIGKTFAATYIGRELVKRGEDVFFIPFNQLLHALRFTDEETLSRLAEVNVLILDEISAPPNEQLRSIMADRFESIVRDRSNYNAVTIMTTNLPEEVIRKEYPRVYSLLREKQMRVELTGNDARQGWVEQQNLELAANNERRPII